MRQIEENSSKQASSSNAVAPDQMTFPEDDDQDLEMKNDQDASEELVHQQLLESLEHRDQSNDDDANYNYTSLDVAQLDELEENEEEQMLNEQEEEEIRESISQLLHNNDHGTFLKLNKYVKCSKIVYTTIIDCNYRYL